VKAVKDTLKLLGGKGGPLITILAAAVTPGQLGNSDRQDIYSEYTDEQITRLREANAAGFAFATAQASKNNDNNGKKTVAIGESQKRRVIPYATRKGHLVIGAGIEYQLRPQPLQGFNQAKALAYNVGWVAGFRAANYQFVDIGRDPRKVALGQPIGIYYAAEKVALTGYARVSQVPNVP